MRMTFEEYFAEDICIWCKEVIEDCIINKNMTIAETAEYFGITPRTLTNILRNRTKPSIESVRKMLIIHRNEKETECQKENKL